MNRRKFLNSLGAAILGTAIALQLPDSLVPQFMEKEEYLHGPEAIFKIIDADLELAMRSMQKYVNRSLYSNPILYKGLEEHLRPTNNL
jgi:hypothetical protein